VKGISKTESEPLIPLIHQWVSEFVTQYWFSIYYSSRDIQSLTAILLFKIFLDLRKNLKTSGPLLYECSISYSTLKRSFAPRILTTTSDPVLENIPFHTWNAAVEVDAVPGSQPLSLLLVHHHQGHRSLYMQGIDWAKGPKLETIPPGPVAARQA
jgi:hypothetical protein